MTLATPVGPAWAEVNHEGAITAFGFGARQYTGNLVNGEVGRQISEYFEGTRTRFDLPLAREGTPFQRKVWTELLKIPFGTVITYRELASRCGVPRSPRAAGRANATNPISLLIPCHRVVGSNGSLTGYAFGLEIKRQLLAFETQAAEMRSNGQK